MMQITSANFIRRVRSEICVSVFRCYGLKGARVIPSFIRNTVTP